MAPQPRQPIYVTQPAKESAPPPRRDEPKQPARPGRETPREQPKEPARFGPETLRAPPRDLARSHREAPRAPPQEPSDDGVFALLRTGSSASRVSTQSIGVVPRPAASQISVTQSYARIDLSQPQSAQRRSDPRHGQHDSTSRHPRPTSSSALRASAHTSSRQLTPTPSMAETDPYNDIKASQASPPSKRSQSRDRRSDSTSQYPVSSSHKPRPSKPSHSTTHTMSNGPSRAPSRSTNRTPPRREIDYVGQLEDEMDLAPPNTAPNFSFAVNDDELEEAPPNPNSRAKAQPPTAVPSHHRSGPDPTVGLTVEQNHAQQRALEIRVNDARDVFRQALDTLRGCCPPCWARGCSYKHDLKSCKAEVANDQDKHWSGWHTKAFQLEDGYCFQCLIPQTRRRGGWHLWLQDNSHCEDKNILKPALYAFVTASSSSQRPLHVEEYPALPDNLFPPGVNEDLLIFRQWCVEPAKNHFPLLKVHLLLLWLIFKRGLVDVPPSLQFVLTDRGDRR
ncbi:hypothetical protein K438DRAFT_1801300 [Mycena galopus ATCC 62051]|nr:hypothetical protein K438DRAFT_1801300 [Mycena galopus ATCC 62051]